MASTSPSNQHGAEAMTVRGAAFLGVGSMVGAGIFALLGQAGAVAGMAVWVSFLIAGVVAFLQGYAVASSALVTRRRAASSPFSCRATAPLTSPL